MNDCCNKIIDQAIDSLNKASEDNEIMAKAVENNQRIGGKVADLAMKYLF